MKMQRTDFASVKLKAIFEHFKLYQHEQWRIFTGINTASWKTENQIFFGVLKKHECTGGQQTNRNQLKIWPNM